jgi:hypothetical protein
MNCKTQLTDSGEWKLIESLEIAAISIGYHHNDLEIFAAMMWKLPLDR